MCPCKSCTCVHLDAHFPVLRLQPLPLQPLPLLPLPLLPLPRSEVMLDVVHGVRQVDNSLTDGRHPVLQVGHVCRQEVQPRARSVKARADHAHPPLQAAQLLPHALLLHHGVLVLKSVSMERTARQEQGLEQGEQVKRALPR